MTGHRVNRLIKVLGAALFLTALLTLALPARIAALPLNAVAEDVGRAAVLPAPTGLTATVTNQSIVLQWSAVAGATNYSIYRGTAAGGEGATPYFVGVTSTTFTNTKIVNSVMYYYQIAAVDATGPGDRSAEAHAGIGLANSSLTPAGGSGPSGSPLGTIFLILLALLASVGGLVLWRRFMPGGRSARDQATGEQAVPSQHLPGGGPAPRPSPPRRLMDFAPPRPTTTPHQFNGDPDETLQQHNISGIRGAQPAPVTGPATDLPPSGARVSRPIGPSSPGGPLPTPPTISRPRTPYELGGVASWQQEPSAAMDDDEAYGEEGNETISQWQAGDAQPDPYAASNVIGPPPPPPPPQRAAGSRHAADPPPSGASQDPVWKNSDTAALIWPADAPQMLPLGAAQQPTQWPGAPALPRPARHAGPLVAIAAILVMGGIIAIFFAVAIALNHQTPNGQAALTGPTTSTTGGTGPSGTPSPAMTQPPPTITPIPATATPPAQALVVAINAGGDGVGPFAADANFTGGQTGSTTNVIDTSGVQNAAPQQVYQTERYGYLPFSYKFHGLHPNGSYLVRLHFAEFFFSQAGQRQFNVSIQGKRKLNNFDIVAEAGGEYKAIIKEFTVQADDHGNITINFSPGSANFPKVDGIEIYATP